MIFFLNPDQGSPSTLENKCRKSETQRITKASVFKRRVAKSFSPEKKVGLTRNPNVQRKKPNAEERKKIEEKVKWKETQRKNKLK